VKLRAVVCTDVEQALTSGNAAMALSSARRLVMASLFLPIYLFYLLGVAMQNNSASLIC
jgi:hypothetical protein